MVVLGSVNLKLPFDQWDDEEGYAKVGLFADRLDRNFNQDTFSNFGDNSTWQGGWDDSWSRAFPWI